MKNLKLLLTYLMFALFLVSCTNENSSEENTTSQSLMTLNKRIILISQSQFPTQNTKEIQYYSNNEIVSDTIFNDINQWIARKITLNQGTTKTYQTLNTNDEIIEHKEETYDNQGRITGTRTYIPENPFLTSYLYNSDNTIAAYTTNLTNGSYLQIAIYHKNLDGLIFKEFKNNFNGTPNIIESTLQFEGSKPTQMSFATSIVPFHYYSTPKPSNLLKSVNELNNEILLGLSLTKLAEQGNYYIKKNNISNSNLTKTYQTDFNSNNYIEYYKSTYLENGDTNQQKTEVFYYYN